MLRNTAQERVLAAAGAAVGSRAPREEVTAEIVDEIRSVIPYEAMHVTVFDPFDDAHRTLANNGYSDRIVRYVEGDYSVRDRAMADIIRTRRPTRMRDTDFDYRESYSFLEYWGPEGYGDGMTTPLFAPDGRYVGLANISTATEDVLTDDVRDFMALLSGVVGAMIDPLADVPAWLADDASPARLLIREDDAIVEDPLGGDGGDHLVGCSREMVIDVARQFRASALSMRQGLVADTAGRLVRIQLTRNRSARLSSAPIVLVAMRDAGDIGLTPRETEVLRHIVDGTSNREIANALGIAPRTVATHVEHLLHKLGIDTRTAATARAIEHGLVRLDVAAAP